MKTQIASPGARRLIESLRNLGYDFATAIADLIDNSLAAEAYEVDVNIVPTNGAVPAHVVISDNGKGMDSKALHEAMRFGAFQEYSEDDLGKFGLGLKTASLSQCRLMTVLSRPKKASGGNSKKTVMRWDLDHVFKKDDWELLVPEGHELKPWENEALENPVAKKHGTVVLWTNLEKTLSGLYSESGSRRDRELASLITDVSKHLRMVFHRFLGGTVSGRKKLTLTVCGEKITPWDPFCLKEKKTEELTPLKLKVGNYFSDSQEKSGTIIFHPFILPREDEFSSKDAHKDAAGPRNWNFQQGFYYYRNNRLLQAGGWSNLRTPDEHTKLLRIVVEFPTHLDTSFSLNITKMKAHIPPEIREIVKTEVGKWTTKAQKVYRKPKKHKVDDDVPAVDSRPVANRPSLKVGGMSFTLGSTPARDISVMGDRKTGDIRVTVPFRHDSAKIFDKMAGQRGDLKRFCLALVTLLEAIEAGKVRPSQIQMNAIRKGLRRVL